MVDNSIVKSSRHSHIIGLYGEHLVCNMLSRSGSEVMRVDHTGMDVLASRPDIGAIGISVKARTRLEGREQINVNVGPSDDTKLLDACRAFKLEAWVGVYVETASSADLFLTSLENFRSRYIAEGRRSLAWGMTPKHRAGYSADQHIMHFQMKFESPRWWKTTTG